MRDRVILDLCGGSGAWAEPYRAAGYEVVIVTLPRFDVRTFQIPGVPVHGILAAPPCTEFAASGARWWARKDPQLLLDALAVVDACLNLIAECQPAFWALENPHGRLRRLRPQLGNATLKFNPCDYGDPYTKLTYVWGKFNVPTKRPVPITHQRGSSPIHRMSPSVDRAARRAVTPQGFAQAFFEANP